jgi:Protein of unknown function (DUF2934)
MPKTTADPAPKTKKAAAKANLTQDDIAARAYLIYLERGATPGDPMQDWLRAERELAAPPKKSSPKSKVITFAA